VPTREETGFVIFLFPLVTSVIASISIVLGDYAPMTKGFYVAMTAVAAGLHFMVPLFMQIFVCGGWYFASQFE
jgi:hypothetical protein